MKVKDCANNITNIALRISLFWQNSVPYHSRRDVALPLRSFQPRYLLRILIFHLLVQLSMPSLAPRSCAFSHCALVFIVIRLIVALRVSVCVFSRYDQYTAVGPLRCLGSSCHHE
jgi:hypothetical protein